MVPSKKISELKPIIVSNRLPIKLEMVDGKWEIQEGSGGLITALAPVLKNNNGTWVGWPGGPVNDELKNFLNAQADDIGYHLSPVEITEEEIIGYYRGFSNQSIWPLLHDLLGMCNFQTDHWESYQRVNYKFAKAVAETSSGNDFIWIQDYHLMLVGHFLSEMGIKDRAAYFLHIPFPPKDIFLKLPWRQEIMEALLHYHLVGFQTERDRRNFISCLKYLMPSAKISHHRKYPFIRYQGNTTRIGAFPISIDFKQFRDLAKSKEVSDSAWYTHEKYPNQKLILGVDRLDYTKGIPHRLLAFENCLKRYPELREKITLIQLVVPSRSKVQQYKDMKRQIDELVGRINSQFGRHGWNPINYMFTTLPKPELLGLYKAAEIALITPLKDGMNLVSKEFCASSVEDKGVLILSEFAGSADQLKDGAILVNPYNIEEVGDAIFQAFYMSEEEQVSRMQKMRRSVMKYDVHRWVDQFIDVYQYSADEQQVSGKKADQPEPAGVND